MPKFLPEPSYTHGTPKRTAIILVNLGTPTAPTKKALKAYLGEFLADPRVIEIPSLIWWPILHGIILTLRPKKSAAKYALIWSSEGSPLRVHTERQSQLLAETLSARGHNQLTVTHAMRYGTPSIDSVLNRLKHDHCTHILVLPLYPQYAASTSATAHDVVCRWLQKTRNQPEIRYLRNFHDHSGYISALAASVREHWQKHPRPQTNYRLIISFHGLPRRTLEQGDPYYCECHKTGRLLIEALELDAQEYRICFQSRFGRAAWLEPYTAPSLSEFASQGVQRIDIICPGFVSDCLETLEEIALEARQIFLNAGGKEYHYIPALNERPDWINTLADIAEKQLYSYLPPPKDPR